MTLILLSLLGVPDDAPWWDHQLIATVVSAVISLATILVYHYAKVKPTTDENREAIGREVQARRQGDIDAGRNEPPLVG